MKTTILTIIFLSFNFTNVYADDISTLINRLSAMQTMQARFNQVTSGARGEIKQKTAGLLQVKRPKYFRWETYSPFNQQLISNGTNVWLYDTDLEQVTIQDLDRRMTNTPALLLSGNAKEINNNFNVLLKQTGNIEDFILTPKTKSSMFETIRISFKDKTLNDMRFTDPTGNTTNITFIDLQANKQIADEIFNFQPPKGVDVIQR